MEAKVKRVKDVENEEEASESASNDAVVASLGRSVGGHSHLRASESDSRAEKKNVLARNGCAKTTVQCGGLRFGDVAWGPVTREGWKPTDRRRERGDLPLILEVKRRTGRRLKTNGQ